jgi:hypothetical protein
VNRTPPVLYTYNAAFRRDRKPTPRRASQVARLDSLLRRYTIEPDQAVYIGAAKKEERVCVSESHALVRRFFEKYEIPQGSVVLSDRGTSYFPKARTYCSRLASKHMHAILPSCISTYPRTITSFTARPRQVGAPKIAIIPTT